MDTHQPYMLCVDEQALHGSSFEPSASLKLSQYSSQPLKHKGFERPVKFSKEQIKSPKPQVPVWEESQEAQPKLKSKKMKPEDMGLKKKDVNSSKRRLGTKARAKSPTSKSKKKARPESSISTTFLELEPTPAIEAATQVKGRMLTESLDAKYLSLLQKYKSLKSKALQEETQGRQLEKKEAVRVKRLEEELKKAQAEQELLNQRILETENIWKEQRRKAIEDGQELLRQKDMEYKNEELKLRIRLQELQNEISWMHQRAASTPQHTNLGSQGNPLPSIPQVVEGFYSRRESRLTDPLKSVNSKSQQQVQPRWMNSDTLNQVHLPGPLKQLESIPKTSLSTKSVRHFGTVLHQPTDRNSATKTSLQPNPVKQLEKVLEQVASDYKKIQQDNKVVKERLEAIQGALLRLEVSVNGTEKTNRTTGHKSVSEMGGQRIDKAANLKSTGGFVRQQTTSTSVVGSALVKQGISELSAGFAEFEDSTSQLTPSGRTSNPKKILSGMTKMHNHVSKTVSKDLHSQKTQSSKRILKSGVDTKQQTRPQESKTQIAQHNWTGQYQNLLSEIHKMKKQMMSLAEENEDMAIMLTDKSMDEPTQDLYHPKKGAFKQVAHKAPKLKAAAKEPIGFTPSQKEAARQEESEESEIEANLDEDSEQDSQAFEREDSDNSDSNTVTPNLQLYQENVELDDTEFYQHQY